MRFNWCEAFEVQTGARGPRQSARCRFRLSGRYRVDGLDIGRIGPVNEECEAACVGYATLKTNWHE